jgi:hypothetical protein
VQLSLCNSLIALLPLITRCTIHSLAQRREPVVHGQGAWSKGIEVMLVEVAVVPCFTILFHLVTAVRPGDLEGHRIALPGTGPEAATTQGAVETGIEDLPLLLAQKLNPNVSQDKVTGKQRSHESGKSMVEKCFAGAQPYGVSQ